MPSKLILNLKEHHGESEVFIQEDGAAPVKLLQVNRVILTADAEGPPTVELHMYSPNWEGKVRICDATAEAIVMHERQRQLSFLDTEDAAGLIALRHTLLNVLDWPPDDHRYKPIGKIISELERREGFPDDDAQDKF